MIYFEDWWNIGENCLEKTYSGILADDKKIDDICISNDESLNEFIENIANISFEYDETTKKYQSHTNTKDVFLNKRVNIDFNKYLLFIFPNAEVKEIQYSQLFQCDMITFSEKSVEEQYYCAAVVQKILNDDKNIKDIKFQIMNEKPPFIKVNRPINDNDDY